MPLLGRPSAHWWGLIAGGVLTVVTVGVQAGGQNLCPEGYCKTEAFVLRCGSLDEEANLLLETNSSIPLSLPAGVANVSFTASADRWMALRVLDPQSGDSILSTAEVKHGSVTWPREEGGAPASNSVHINVTRHKETQVSMAVEGVLPRPLLLRLTSNADKAAVAGTTLRYSSFQGCPSVPIGCSAYNSTEARDTVQTWSAWASAQHHTAAAAWTAMCQPTLQAGGIGNSLTIPFHLWERIWVEWPSAKKEGLPEWHFVFKYIDSLVTEDQVISKEEFDRAFDLAGVGLSVFTWCTYLHATHQTAADAWKALGAPYKSGDDIDMDTWTNAVWGPFTPLDHFNKAPTTAPTLEPTLAPTSAPTGALRHEGAFFFVCTVQPLRLYARLLQDRKSVV